MDGPDADAAGDPDEAKRHGYKLGYTLTRPALQRAGPVRPAARRSAHRKKRPRRPMAGMLLHQDGLRHARLPGDARRYELIATLDDAASELVSAFLVPERGRPRPSARSAR